jgi:hypothetical protein
MVGKEWVYRRCDGSILVELEEEFFFPSVKVTVEKGRTNGTRFI